MPIKAPDNWFRGPFGLKVGEQAFVGVVRNNLPNRVQIDNWAARPIEVEPRRAPPPPPQPMAPPRPNAFNFPRAADPVRNQPARIRPIGQPMRHPDAIHARPIRPDDVLQPVQGMFYFNNPAWANDPFEDDGREITKEDIV